ncbi:hypothetical protein ACFOZY_01010 [Chungangia koreensis]|uniref:Zorya protein ZorC EH domain-containing protein n=1 Tax=Chungangia koreensis TaxID=752657 RepID=A0ABV8WZC2_9LACT
MKYEYRPTRLTDWVRREIKSKPTYHNQNTEKISNRLERLRGALSVLETKSTEEFQNWLESLTSRDVVLLPYLYKEVKQENQKPMLKIMLEIGANKRQMYRNCIEMCYRTGDFNPYWWIANTSFKKNKDSITRNWSKEKLLRWEKFIDTPDNYASKMAVLIEYENDTEEVFQDFYINNGHRFYKDVLLRLFENGSKKTFRSEKQLFLKYFENADNITMQKLAAGFIRTGLLNELDDISRKIYEKMGTYIRKSMLWSEVETRLKKAFHQWVLRQNIREFFLHLNKDHERFGYWEKFIPKMEDAVVLKKEQTVLFYFSDVVIMEILGTGAAYVYEKIYFQNRWGQRIDKYLEAVERAEILNMSYITVKLTRSMLMDKDAVVKNGWLTHSGDWKFKFDRFLRYSLNWEVNKDEILRKNENFFTL